MTKDQFRTWIERQDWKVTSFGHYHKGDMRFKIQKHTVRLERSYVTPGSQYSKPEKRWLKIQGGRFSKMSISSKDKLIGLTK